jgi:hypothetical protein
MKYNCSFYFLEETLKKIPTVNNQNLKKIVFAIKSNLINSKFFDLFLTHSKDVIFMKLMIEI